MSTRRRWPRIVALVLAGVLSAFLSLSGFGIMLWGGLPKAGERLLWCGLVLPLILSFPLFLSSLGITKLGIAGLWLVLLMHFSFGLHMHWEFTKRYAFMPAALFVAQAVLVTYGAGCFRQFRADQSVMRRFGAYRDRTT